MIDLRIHSGSPTPIYKQIVDQIGMAAGTGALHPGDALPSVRALAERLVVNANTVARAYAELVREGLVDARHGKGFFVAERRQVYAKGERARRLDAAVAALINEAALLGLEADDVRTAVERELTRFVPRGGK
jgi:GntR family transcriptional regulator